MVNKLGTGQFMNEIPWEQQNTTSYFNFIIQGPVQSSEIDCL